MCCDWNAFLTSEQASNKKNIFLTIRNRIKRLKYYQRNYLLYLYTIYAQFDFILKRFSYNKTK